MKWNYCLDKIPEPGRGILEFQACGCSECVNLPVNKIKISDGHGILTRNKHTDTQKQWDSYVKWMCKEGREKGYTFHRFWWIYLDELSLPEIGGRYPWDNIELPNEIECDCDDDFDCDKHRETGSLEERALRLAQEMRDQSGIIEELRSPAHIPTINKDKWSSETFKDLKPLPVSNDL